MSIEILLMGIVALATSFTALYSLVDGRRAFLDNVENDVISFGRYVKNWKSFKKRFNIGVYAAGYDMSLKISPLRTILRELEKRWFVRKFFYRTLFAKASLLISSLTQHQEEIRKILGQLEIKTRIVLEEFAKENYQTLETGLGNSLVENALTLESFQANPRILVKVEGSHIPLESFIFSDVAVKNVLAQCPVELGTRDREIHLPTQISNLLCEKIVNSFKEDKTLERISKIAGMLDKKMEDLGKEYLKKFKVWASP